MDRPGWVPLPLGRRARRGFLLDGRVVVAAGDRGWLVVDRETDHYRPGFETLGDAQDYAEALLGSELRLRPPPEGRAEETRAGAGEDSRNPVEEEPGLTDRPALAPGSSLAVPRTDHAPLGRVSAMPTTPEARPVPGDRRGRAR